MAYDHNNYDLVNLIDALNGTLWSFMKPRDRIIRKKKPLEEKLRERLEILDDIVVTDNNTDNERTTQESNSVPLSPKLGNAKNIRVKPDAVRLPKTTPKTARCVVDSGVKTKQTLLSIPMTSTPREPESSLPGIGDVTKSNTRTYRYTYTRDFLARQKDRVLHKAACDQQRRRFTVGDLPQHMWKTYRRPCDIQKKDATPRLRYVNGPDTLEARIQSPTRLLSPWREDDAILLHNLKSRSGSVSHRTQKPALSRRQALLPLLPENETHMKLYDIIYNERLVTPQLPVPKSSWHEFSPTIDRGIRQVDYSMGATTSTPCTTPVMPTRRRSIRSRTPETTSKEDKYPRAKTNLEPIGKKTLRWEFDIDRVVPPTVVRFTAPSPEPSGEAEETFEYSVPMTASLT